MVPSVPAQPLAIAGDTCHKQSIARKEQKNQPQERRHCSSPSTSLRGAMQELVALEKDKIAVAHEMLVGK